MIGTVLRQGLLFLHLVAFAWALVAVTRANLAVLRTRRVDAAHLRRMAAWTTVWLAAAWISGLGLALIDSRFDVIALWDQPARLAKAVAIVWLTVHAVLIHRVALPMLTMPQAEPSRSATLCTVIGVSSSFAWLFAGLAGACTLWAPEWMRDDYLAIFGGGLLLSLGCGYAVAQPRLQRMMLAAARMKAAKFPMQAELASFDFDASPITRDKVFLLANGGFIDRAENVLIIGAAGTGKTHLATAIGTAAITRLDKLVRCYSGVALAHALEREEAEGRSGEMVERLRQIDLLIIDALGPHALGRAGAVLMFQMLVKLQGNTSVMVTTTLDCAEWAKVLGKGKMTLALLDRFTEYCHVLRTGDTPQDAEDATMPDSSYQRRRARVKARRDLLGQVASLRPLLDQLRPPDTEFQPSFAPWPEARHSRGNSRSNSRGHSRNSSRHHSRPHTLPRVNK